MPQSSETYTYRRGKKIVLEKRPDEFVVRARPEELVALGIADAERVSSASSRVRARATDLEPLMSRARHVAPTHHAYYVADTGDEFLITDRVVVTFRQPLPSAQVDAFAARYGLVQKAAYSDRQYLFQLTDHTGMNPVKLVVKLTEDEQRLVEAAEHDLNRRMSTYAFQIPTDPAYARQWHLHTRLQDVQFDPRASSRCEQAWQALDGFGSSEVVVGLTDDGCKLDHPDFSSNKFAGWGYLRGERLITNGDVDANPAEMYQPGANHGTSCAGVIAGEADAVLTVGAAPGCRLLPIQWESQGPSLFISDSKLRTVLDYVADKIDVLSNSWGSVPDNTWLPIVTDRVTVLARTGGRRGRGIVFLWAAGNENCPIQHGAAVDVPYTNGWARRPDGSIVWAGVRRARNFENNLVGIRGVIHVAALASTGQRSHYSNYGTAIGLCAPTNNVHEYRRLTVAGLGVTTTTGAAGGVTAQFGGTSSATPLVAGIAALVISAHPELTAFEVISILKQTAAKDLSFEGYPRTPPAAFDPNPNWDVSPIAPFDQGGFANTGDPDGTWSPWFGHGRVDAAKAVAAALARKGGASQQTFRRSSAPNLSIPDNDPAGVRTTVHFAEAARIAALKVQVDLTHSYVGDLRLTLTAPSGTAVVLHDRNGGNTHDIKRAFDPTTTPALSSLVGQSLQGDWTLHVQDLARVDTGRLNRWELEAAGQPDAFVELSESPATNIPDNNAGGVERALTAGTPGRAGEVTVVVDITHTYIGDLSVALVSPSNTVIPLHQRTGGSADNLITTYTATNTAGLRQLRGEPIQGPWRLKVADHEAIDVGRLNHWAVRIERQP